MRWIFNLELVFLYYPCFLLLTNSHIPLQFYNLIKVLSTPSTAPALFGGGLLGYVMYDVTHYYLHHGQPTSDVPKSLKVIRYLDGTTYNAYLVLRNINSLSYNQKSLPLDSLPQLELIFSGFISFHFLLLFCRNIIWIITSVSKTKVLELHPPSGTRYLEHCLQQSQLRRVGKFQAPSFK